MKKSSLSVGGGGGGAGGNDVTSANAASIAGGSSGGSSGSSGRGRVVAILLIIISVSSFAYYLLHTSHSGMDYAIGGRNNDLSNNDISSISKKGEAYVNIDSLLAKLESEHSIIEDVIKTYEKKLENVNKNLRKGGDNLPATSNSPSSSSSSSSANEPLPTSIKTSPDSRIKSPISFSSYTSDNQSGQKDKAVVVIAGTDGSGTRQVVKLLTSLGAIVVSEDPETYDIHADLIGGWPPFVYKVLRHTKSIYYNFDSLPANIQENAGRDAERLLKQIERDSHKPTSYQLAVGGVLPRRQDADCSKMLYGFKAPIAMSMVPLWAHKLPHFKFLHVLRDGRDIAFSANQGPVEKFFESMYESRFNHLNPAEKAIKLWSDWNFQAFAWSRDYAEKYRKEKVNDKSFEYLAVHTEDLIGDDITVKFALIKHIAELVGSSLSDLQLCCLAMEEVEFMGSHDRTERSADKYQRAQQVKSRYGKWRSRVGENTMFKESLHKLGENGLKTFGYEPMRGLSQQGSVTKSGFSCSIDVIRENRDTVRCPAAYQGSTFKGGSPPAAANPNPNPYPNPDPVNSNNEVPNNYNFAQGDPFSKEFSTKFQLPSPVLSSPYGTIGVCRVYEKIDFKGGDMEIGGVESLSGTSQNECCDKCKMKQNDGCQFYTYDTDSFMCYLKFSKGLPVASPKGNLFSGELII